MCMGGGSPPPVPPPPPPPAPPPTLPDQGVTQAGTDAKSKAAMAAGMMQNVATGPQGLTQAASTTAGTKTMLGG